MSVSRGNSAKIPSLPFHVVEDILCRLPVKPLKRFRCVAKSWVLLIDSERFVKLHLKRSLDTNSHRHLIAGSKRTVYTVDFENDVAVKPKARVKAKARVIRPPFPNSIDDISISCNGLFLIWGCQNVQSLVLWNPFTREYKMLPGVGDELECRTSKISYGFAYDSTNDDYKVVRVVEHRDIMHGFASRAHIYSLKLNSWRQTKTFTYPVPHLIKTNVCGALHTVLRQCRQGENGPGTAKIFGFSVESETHYEMELPLGITKNAILSLQEIGGCLSVISTSESGIVTWVMKDYWVKKSLTKLLSIPIKLTITELDNPETTKPLVYSRDGHKVLMYLGYDTLFWQDLRNQSLENVPVRGLPFLDYVEACVESLVSLRSEQPQKKQVVHDHDKKDNKKIKNKSDDFLSKGFKLVL